MVATDLIEHIKQNIPYFNKSTVHEIVFDGDALAGTSYTNPFNIDNIQPMLPSDHVGSKTGTGLVHIAPALGQDDFKLAIRHDLQTKCVVNEQGRYDAGDSILQSFQLCGESVLDPKTNEKIKKILGGSVLHSHVYTHSYPYDWRTKKPCIIRSSMQWFIDTNQLKADSLEALGKVNIRPSNVIGSMNGTLASRPYWCISRQRSWGLPIPCLFTDDGKEVITKELVEEVKASIQKDGNVDFWWTNNRGEQLFKTSEKENVKSKSKDIFDIWFDSGSSFNSILGTF